jgi:hypothetical protein
LLVENYSNSRSLLSHKTVEAIFSDLRVEPMMNPTYCLPDQMRFLKKSDQMRLKKNNRSLRARRLRMGPLEMHATGLKTQESTQNANPRRFVNFRNISSLTDWNRACFQALRNEALAVCRLGSDVVTQKGLPHSAIVPCRRRQARQDRSKLRTLTPQRKIDVKSEQPVGCVSVFTLIRTDTTLDHSQKAEKVCTPWAPGNHFVTLSEAMQATCGSRSTHRSGTDGVLLHSNAHCEFKVCWKQRYHAGLRCQKLCCGSPHRGAHRSHRRQSAVTCSADRE